MSSRSGDRIWTWGSPLRWVQVSLVSLGCIAACGSEPGEPKQAPAIVEGAVAEAELAMLRLSAKAEERLGIETVAIERREVERTRKVGGDVVVPPGRSITVSAAQSGVVLAPRGRKLPAPGKRVKRGQTLLRLLVVPPGEISRARQMVALAEARFGLAKKSPGVDPAGAQRELVAARGRLDLLLGNAPYLDSGEFTPLTVSSPHDGVIQRLLAGPGQTVAAAAALVEIVSLDPLWIRVPVYVGDRAAIALEAPAGVQSLSGFPAEPRVAEPIAAPPSADPRSASLDLYYELDNADESFLPGERVLVTLVYRGEESSLVVPWSAIIRDHDGGAWVYERTQPQTYQRRKVIVRYIAGATAVLERGPAPGAEIVRSGAAELFGTEFGVGK